ncbi:carboxypeptidase B-like [Schistocerca piceifrons]|uniref:carboxypeptidase B-like n=1 Tax=Schistocerca piceifrons TaxID=274613 RepID=UPI001F5F9C4C|nr:carboxypeptidase B-like [Schistocerca piceifrons]
MSRRCSPPLLLLAAGLLLLLLLLAAADASQRKSYRGYLLVRTAPVEDAARLAAVSALDSVRGVLVLSMPSPQRGAVIAVAPHSAEDVRVHLSAAGVTYTVETDDLEQLLERGRSQTRNLAELPQGGVSFDRFMTLDEIYAYLDTLATQYPDLVTLETIGQSTEGRDLKLVKVVTASSDSDAAKPVIFVDATIHAREWLAPCVALYTLQQLVENSTASASLLQAADWYLLPVLNPDGYDYTHNTDRLWRKTRSYQGSDDPDCMGVDANRNYDFHWGGEGSSTDPCSETFAGPSPFSEPEARNHAAFLRANNDSISLYLTLHSYGQLFLYPWGWTTDYPDNVDELHALGIAATAALAAVRGTQYTVGSSANVLYFSSGSSRDYAKGVPGARFSYTLELPEGGASGFDPEPSAIWPVVTETFELIKVLADAVSGQWQPPATSS